MTNAIIVHGMPGKDEYYSADYPSMSNSHWLPWLQKQLLINEIPTATPEIPHAFKPVYEIWKKEFERFDITPDTNLVGHSCGGGFLVRWLSEHGDVVVKNVVLVAPWIDPFREDTTDFFKFVIDPELASRTKSLWIFNSDTDSKGVHSTVDTIRSSINDVKYKEFHEYGHFTLRGMGTEEFPELVEALIDK
ncbi:MAG: alpha/beta hydrolase [Candidatus Microsaccharimonas sp.]